LHNVKSLLPVFGAAGKQYKSKSVCLAKLRPFDLTLDHDQLLAQERIFCEKVCLASCQI